MGILRSIFKEKSGIIVKNFGLLSSPSAFLGNKQNFPVPYCFEVGVGVWPPRLHVGRGSLYPPPPNKASHTSLPAPTMGWVVEMRCSWSPRGNARKSGHPDPLAQSAEPDPAPVLAPDPPTTGGGGGSDPILTQKEARGKPVPFSQRLTIVAEVGI